MALASLYTKRVVLLNHGQIIMDGPTHEVFAQPEILAKTMLEPPQITRLGQRLTNSGYPADILTVDEFVNFFSKTK